MSTLQDLVTALRELASIRVAMAVCLIVFLAVGVGVSGAFAPVDLSDGTILLLTFGDNSNGGITIEDESTAANHGEFVDGSDPELDESTGAIRFSENSSHVRVELDETIEEEFTVSARLHHSAHDHYSGVVTSDSWRLNAVSDRYEFIVEDDEESLRVEDVELDQWNHVAITHNYGWLVFYLNGEEVDATYVEEDVSSDTILVGERPTGEHPYEGQIDDVRVYDRVLTDEEVRGIYADREQIRPVLYTDEFRVLAAASLLLVAFAAARLEYRYRTK